MEKNFVTKTASPCPDCGATTAYNYPDEMPCVRCGTDRTPPAGAWNPGLDMNSGYRAAALMNPARIR